MPKFLVKCNYEKLFSADVDVELPDDEDELAEFMEEFEDENEVIWTEVKVVFDYTGYEAQRFTSTLEINLSNQQLKRPFLSFGSS